MNSPHPQVGVSPSPVSMEDVNRKLLEAFSNLVIEAAATLLRTDGQSLNASMRIQLKKDRGLLEGIIKVIDEMLNDESDR